MNLQFNPLLTEITGDYDGTQFYMNVKLIGDEGPELYFSDENYYTMDGDPKSLQPQKRRQLIEAIEEHVYESQEFQSMLRDWNISQYEYSNDY